MLSNAVTLATAALPIAANRFGLLLSGAADPLDVSTVMTSGFQTVQTKVMDVLKIAVPAILGITAVIVAVKFGISWVKKVKG